MSLIKKSSLLLITVLIVFVVRGQNKEKFLDSLLLNLEFTSESRILVLDDIDTINLHTSIERGLLNLNYGVYYSELRSFDKAIYFLERSKPQLKLANNKKYIAKVYNELGAVKLFLGEFKQARENYIKATTLYEDLGDSLAVAKMLFNCINISVNSNELDRALNELDKFSEYSNISPKLRIKYYLKKSNILFQTRQNDSAFHYVFLANEKSIEEKDTVNIFASYHTISNYYFQIDNYTQSLVFAEKALSIARKPYNEEYVLSAQDLLSSLLIEKEELNEAEKVILESLDIAKKRNDVYRLSTLYLKLGNTYTLRGNSKESIVYNKKALNLFEQFDYKQGICTVYRNIGGNLYKEKKYDEAEEYLKKSYLMATDMADFSLQRESLEVLYLTLKAQSNFKEAISYLEVLQAVRDSISEINNSEELKLTELDYEKKLKNYETENVRLELLEKQKEIELKLKSKEALKNKYLLISIISLVVLAIIILFFLYRSYENKQRLRIIESKFFTSESEKNKLFTEVKELSIQSDSKAAIIKHLEENLEQPSNIKTISELIGEGLHSDKKNAQFIAEFQLQYGTFYNKLITAHSLTSSDIRICALIKLNLSTKEIADVINITTAGVRKAKNRIKEKIPLNKDESLDKYIVALK